MCPVSLRAESNCKGNHTDLHSIVTQALESVEPLIAQKQHRLLLASEPEKLFVDGDSARLIQCVTNLLTNAVKYTGNGGEIRMEAGSDHEQCRDFGE